MEELCHFFVKIIPLLVRNHIKIFYIEEGEDVLSFMRRKKPSRKSIQEEHKNVLVKILDVDIFKEI